MPQSPIRLNANDRLLDENGTPTNLFLQHMTKLAISVTIVGTGTPEGQVEATQYTVYVDETIPLTPVTYRKMLPDLSGDRTKGWALA